MKIRILRNDQSISGALKRSGTRQDLRIPPVAKLLTCSATPMIGASFLIACVNAVMASKVLADRDIYVFTDASAGGDGIQRALFWTLMETRDSIRAAPQPHELYSNDAFILHIGSAVCGTAPAANEGV